jgi:hypothetical protein
MIFCILRTTHTDANGRKATSPSSCFNACRAAISRKGVPTKGANGSAMIRTILGAKVEAAAVARDRDSAADSDIGHMSHSRDAEH